MAFRDTSQITPRLPHFFNVEQAVGPTGVNGRSDVMLVQYLLRGIYAPHGPAVDGWIGPITNAYIKAFQKEIRGRGADVATDGRVDRATSVRSSITKTVYTILVLNQSLRSIDPNAFKRIPEQVPLSANPRSNPYNAVPGAGTPAPMQDWGHQLIAGGPYVVDKVLYVHAGGSQYVLVWSDGTKTPVGPVFSHG
jgi:hypothetical protein